MQGVKEVCIEKDELGYEDGGDEGVDGNVIEYSL